MPDERRPPHRRLGEKSALAGVLVEGSENGLLSAAHDLSDGGLAQALVECVLSGGVGARVELPGDPFVALFSESAARALATAPPAAVDDIAALCRAAGVPVTRPGTVGGDRLEVAGQFAVPLAELRTAHETTLPRARWLPRWLPWRRTA